MKSFLLNRHRWKIRFFLLRGHVIFIGRNKCTIYIFASENKKVAMVTRLNKLVGFISFKYITWAEFNLKSVRGENFPFWDFVLSYFDRLRSFSTSWFLCGRDFCIWSSWNVFLNCLLSKQVIKIYIIDRTLHVCLRIWIYLPVLIISLTPSLRSFLRVVINTRSKIFDSFPRPAM